MKNMTNILVNVLLFVVSITHVESFAPSILHRSNIRSYMPSNHNIRKLSTTEPVVDTAFPSLKLKDAAAALVDAKGKFPYVENTATVLDAVETMNSFKQGSVLVLDQEGNLDGIFTERDFVTKIMDAGRNSASVPITEVMTGQEVLKRATKDTTLNECKQILLDNKIRRLPIIDENGRPIGVISIREILAALQNEDLQRGSAPLYGETLEEIELQARRAANLKALEGGDEAAKQDLIRSSFVVAAATVGAGILQGDWIHQHEYISMCAVFLLGYIGIIFESALEFNKAGIALLMSAALWVTYAGTAGATGIALASPLGQLGDKISEVSEVIYFILGAMTIVEIVDAHQGFKVVTDKISSQNKRGLLRVISLITFFMSAILDNLTTTIVMVSLLKKLLPDIEDRKLFGAMVVIAANAGGAWTPIGDVTTTMLWISGQISVLPTMTDLFLPSITSMIISLLVLERQIPENEPVPEPTRQNSKLAPRGSLVFTTGLVGLLSVPVFKSVTGLPPYLGMLASLGVLWSLTDAIHKGDEGEELKAPAALKKIDTSGVLFFLGILLSVGALDSAGILRSLAEFLDRTISSETVIASVIGAASALIDNVPLVAATMGMYTLADKPMDDNLWQLIAYCAGTGGSMLVIGSAAGVALMGLEKVDFMWYAKRISIGAAAGYLTGIGVYLGQSLITNTMIANAADVATAVLPHLPN